MGIEKASGGNDGGGMRRDTNSAEASKLKPINLENAGVYDEKAPAQARLDRMRLSSFHGKYCGPEQEKAYHAEVYEVTRHHTTPETKELQLKITEDTIAVGVPTTVAKKMLVGELGPKVKCVSKNRGSKGKDKGDDDDDDE